MQLLPFFWWEGQRPFLWGTKCHHPAFDWDGRAFFFLFCRVEEKSATSPRYGQLVVFFFCFFFFWGLDSAFALFWWEG